MTADEALRKVIELLEGEKPCCTCCGGDDAYLALVRDAKALAAQVTA